MHDVSLIGAALIFYIESKGCKNKAESTVYGSHDGCDEDCADTGWWRESDPGDCEKPGLRYMAVSLCLLSRLPLIMQLSECLLRIYQYSIEGVISEAEASSGDVQSAVMVNIKSFLRAMCLDIPAPLPGRLRIL